MRLVKARGSGWLRNTIAGALGLMVVCMLSATIVSAAPKVRSYTEAYDRNLGAFRVVVTGVDASYRNISIAVWSAVDGQDDLKWYTPVKRSDGSWYVNIGTVNHKSSSGKYYADTWATDRSGKRVYLCGAQQITEGISKQTYKASDISGNQTKYRVEATGVRCQGMREVKVAVWSVDKGQDDLRWYTATVSDKRFSVDLPISNHKSAGKYYADAYLVGSGGKKFFLGSTSFTVARASATGVRVTNLNNNNGTFRVAVSGVKAPSGVSKVEIPTWCDPNQKDIKWYVAQKDASGNWYANVNIVNHDYHTGKYISHVYVTAKNGVRNYVGKTETTVNLSKEAVAKLAPKVVIKDLDQSKGTFRVQANHITGNPSKVRVAVWSGTDRARSFYWYDMVRQSNGSYMATASFQNHRAMKGTYYADVWLTVSGAQKYHGGTTKTNPFQGTKKTYTYKTSVGTMYYAANGNGKIVTLDPGHAYRVSGGTEPNGPGSGTYKAKDTYGTAGVATKKAECELVLPVAQKLKDELLKRGYSVILTHETNDIAISCVERTNVANTVKADAYLRIHADGGDPSARGALMVSISSSNPYKRSMYSQCQKLSECVLAEYIKSTGLKNRGIWNTDTMTGNNWSNVPTTLIELGYMSNYSEDLWMANASNQVKMVQGMANGIDKYFG